MKGWGERAFSVWVALGLAWASAGCGGGADADAEAAPARRPWLALLEEKEIRTIVSENERLPVRVDLMRPVKSGKGARGRFPGLEMTPPCEIRFELPELPPGAQLDLAPGILWKGHVEDGTVRFQAELDGASMLDLELDCSHAVPNPERMWHDVALDLPRAGGVLTLRTSYSGTSAKPPRAAFARLEVTEPFEFAREPASLERPNLVLVVIDTLRADRLHSYGNGDETSPVLDGLAREGTLFERAYAAAPWTVPSTMALLTSVSPHRGAGKGFWGSNYLVSSFTTLAEVLQEEGWTTGGFSCNTLVSMSRNFDQGFETYRDYNWGPGRGDYRRRPFLARWPVAEPLLSLPARRRPARPVLARGGLPGPVRRPTPRGLRRPHAEGLHEPVLERRRRRAGAVR